MPGSVNAAGSNAAGNCGGCLAGRWQSSPRAANPDSGANSGTVPLHCSQQLQQPHASSLHQQVTGGRLHGVVKSGNIPLPGVTVTAQNTLTGKRYSTTTDITGAWSLTIPQNGRYVIRTQFAAFAPGRAGGGAQRDQPRPDSELRVDAGLARRRAGAAAAGRQGQAAQAAQAIRQLAGNGAQNLSLMSALAADTETQTGAVRRQRRGLAFDRRQLRLQR